MCFTQMPGNVATIDHRLLHDYRYNEYRRLEY